MLKLVLRIDPIDSAGADYLISTVGVNAGTSLTAQRQLDIYNEARMTLASLVDRFIPDETLRQRAVSGNIVRSTASQFASGIMSKPTGWVSSIALQTSTFLPISIVAPEALPRLQYQSLGSALNPWVIDTDTRFIDPTLGTNCPNASTYVFHYFGVSDFALSDVTGGATVETFNPRYLTLLLDIAESISLEQGSGQIDGIFAQFVAKNGIT